MEKMQGPEQPEIMGQTTIKMHLENPFKWCDTAWYT